MTSAEFNMFATKRLAEVLQRLERKGEEYNRDIRDRLSNLKREAAFLGCTLLQNCMSKLSKHLVSLADMSNAGGGTPEQWKEKCGDAIAYLVLLEACSTEPDR